MIIKYCVIKYLTKHGDRSYVGVHKRPTIIGNMDVPVKRSDFDFIELVVDCVDEKFPRPEYSCIAFEFLEE